MANVFGYPFIVLDTFTSAIDVKEKLANHGYKIKIFSIHWMTPTTADHTALISDDDGNPIFSETCVTAKQSIIKYYNEVPVSNIKIAQSGVGSGKIIIQLPPGWQA